MRAWLLFALSLVAGNARATLVGKTLDLSNGVSFPSNNSALFENPAVLGLQKARAVQLGVFYDGKSAPSTGTASLVADVGSFGFGVGTWKSSPSTDSLTFGAGKRFGESFGLGVNATYAFQTGAAAFDLGAEFALTSGLTVGAVLYHLDPMPAQWTLGLANVFWNKVILELDFQSQDYPESFESASIRCLAGLSILLGEYLAVRVGYPFGVYPGFDFNSPDVELGISVSFTKNFSAFAVRNQHPGIPYFVGLMFH